MDQIKTKVVKINEAYRRMREEERSFSLEDRNRPETLTDEDRKVLEEAAAVIRNGGLAAFPTETVYGLGADALNEEAARKIYAAKGRPSDNPLIAHIAKKEDIEPLVREIPEAGKKLMDAFWPGPLTLIFPKSGRVPKGTTGGLDTVAVRMPSDPVARRLIELAGTPVAAPSANTSGRPSPTTAEHVRQDMDGRIEMIVDGGPVGIGVESTIVDVTGEIPMVLRPGAITMEMLKKCVGAVEIDPAILGPVSQDFKPKAPGMKYRHYAPKADLTIVSGETEDVVRAISRMAAERESEGLSVGIICTDETRALYPCGVVRSMGVRARQETIAHNLYAVLREFDDLNADVIYSESFEGGELSQAIMNRLCKAAGYHMMNV